MGAQGEQMANHFLMHRAVTLDLASRLPADKMDWQPWSGAMPVGQLLVHMAGAHHGLLGAAQGETMTRPDPSQMPKELGAIRAMLQELTDRDAATLRGMSDEVLATEREAFGGRKMPAVALVGAAIDHEIHHKGQLYVYARILGVEPPFFVKM